MFLEGMRVERRRGDVHEQREPFSACVPAAVKGRLVRQWVENGLGSWRPFLLLTFLLADKRKVRTGVKGRELSLSTNKNKKHSLNREFRSEEETVF